MIGIRFAISIRARGHRPHLEAVYMTAPRSACRNTKKALAERGPSIHDDKSGCRLLPLPMQLHRQSFHRIGHLAPSRQPASWKTKRQIGAVDSALAQAHSRGRTLARAAGVEVRRVSKEQGFVAV